MVYYFTSTVVEPSAYVYVGKDKFESMEPTSPHGPLDIPFTRDFIALERVKTDA